jgi:hypothetical protein
MDGGATEDLKPDEIDFTLTKEEEALLEEHEEFRVLRAEYPKRKGRQPNEFFKRLTLLKKKYLLKRTISSKQIPEEEEKKGEE